MPVGWVFKRVGVFAKKFVVVVRIFAGQLTRGFYRAGSEESHCWHCITESYGAFFGCKG